MIELTEHEREVLEGLLPRIYAERDRIGDDDPDVSGMLDDMGWWIESVMCHDL